MRMVIGLLLGFCFVGCLPKTKMNARSTQAVDFYDLRLEIESDKLRYYLGDVPYTGEAIDFYESGEKEARFLFDDGRAHGTAVTWDKSGQKVSEAQWEKGRLVEERVYHQGTLVRTKNY